MIRKVTIILAAIIGLSFGFTLGPYIWETLSLNNRVIINPVLNSIIFGLIFMFLGSLLAPLIERFIFKAVELLERQSTPSLIIGGIGLLLGLLIGYLIALPLSNLNIPVLSPIIPLILAISGGLIGYLITTNRQDEIINFFTRSANRMTHSPKNTPVENSEKEKSLTEEDPNEGSHYKILDTSVIIDGRIADIVKTGFIEGVLVVPNFVLAELQHIADSSDSLKRTKGRRGLDILNALQKDESITIQFYEGDFEEINEVDAKLVRLAKELKGSLVTNDYNLNKVSEFQNVPVLNINQLANALKPALIPGEEMRVQIMKAGTERRQGVAYLDDGTMVVVEEGLDHMNEWLQVTVTSALQTAAGRMIFAKINE